jgi:hypothetical protein|tara:strand:+ start:179 stop:370 length:192 start_codon:yes stop_codon:yes gene_type:complete
MSDTRAVELDKVLYVRVDAALLKGLDRLAAAEKKRTPSRKVTRSDVARDILYAELLPKKRGKK